MEGAEEKSDGQTLEYVNLIFAIVLAALATPIVKWLVVHGGKLGISNPNAISFCNIISVQVSLSLPPSVGGDSGPS